MPLGAGLLALALAAGAGAPREERLDHRGQLGVVAVPEVERLFGSGVDSDRLAAGLALGVTLPLSDEGLEGVLTLHGLDAAPPALQPRVTLGGDLRGLEGDEAWKSFFEIGLRLPVWELPGARARFGLGVQFDPSSTFGVWLGVGAGAGVTTGGFTFGLDAGVGLQWRFSAPTA